MHFMKKFFLIAAAALLTLAACEKPGPENTDPTPGKTPTVSISADNTFNDAMKANVTLTLSAAAAEDVTVKLAKGDIQSGKTLIPADFDKTVVIEKGKTTATVEVTADATGLSDGEFQSAIKIASATGAEVAENAIVYINVTFEYKPSVNVFADEFFEGDKTAKIKVAIDKAIAKDVKATIQFASENAFEVALATNPIVIPAGSTEAEAVATITIPDGTAPGNYPIALSIKEAENAVLGNATNATVTLSYPFSVQINIDGDFSDWNNANVQTFTPQDISKSCYRALKVVKAAATPQYLYFYFEFNHLEYTTPNEFLNLPFDLILDADGDYATGGYVGNIDNDHAYPMFENEKIGMEWYCEFSLWDGTYFSDWNYWPAMYEFTGNGGDIIWGNLVNRNAEPGTAQSFGTGVYDENEHVGRVECQLSRSWYHITNTTCRFAAKLMNGNNNWACIGLIPQGIATDINNVETRAMCDMATVSLPKYQE